MITNINYKKELMGLSTSIRHKELQQHGITYLFKTNNSSRSWYSLFNGILILTK